MTANIEPQRHDHQEGDVKICQECLELMTNSAEKCRTLSARSTTSICKGGLLTAAFVCEGLAKSMEKCIEAMTKSEHIGYNKSTSAAEHKPLM